MKAKIVYVREGVETTTENLNINFVDFCKKLFRKKIYISGFDTKEGVALAINTDNILFVEEIKE